MATRTISIKLNLDKGDFLKDLNNINSEVEDLIGNFSDLFKSSPKGMREIKKAVDQFKKSTVESSSEIKNLSKEIKKMGKEKADEEINKAKEATKEFIADMKNLARLARLDKVFLLTTKSARVLGRELGNIGGSLSRGIKDVPGDFAKIGETIKNNLQGHLGGAGKFAQNTLGNFAGSFKKAFAGITQSTGYIAFLDNSRVIMNDINNIVGSIKSGFTTLGLKIKGIVSGGVQILQSYLARGAAILNTMGVYGKNLATSIGQTISKLPGFQKGLNLIHSTTEKLGRVFSSMQKGQGPVWLQKTVSSLKDTALYKNVSARFGEIKASANKAYVEIGKIWGSVMKTDKASGKASISFGKIGKAISGLGIQGMMQNFAKESLEAFGTFEENKVTLTSVFSNMTDPAGEAAKAMADINKLGGALPVPDKEITDSYINLARNGIRPSITEMTAFTDLALSKGKTLTDLSTAMVSASKGEMDGLKDFGIEATKQGKNTVLEFNGLKQVIDGSPESIQKAMTKFGEMKGVAGLAGELGDTWNGQMTRINNMVKAVKAEFGQLLSTILGPFLKFFTDTDHGAERLRKAMKVLAIVGVAALVAIGISGWTAMAPIIAGALPIIAIGVALGVLYLLFEDFYKFLFQSGGESNSMFQQWMEEMFGGEVVEEFRQTLLTIWNAFAWIGKKIGEIALLLWPYIQWALQFVGWIVAVGLLFALWPVVLATAVALLIAYIVNNIESIKNMFFEAWDAIGKQFEAMIDWSALLEKGKAFLSDLNPVNWWKSKNGSKTTPESKQTDGQLASGGPVRAGGTYLVGEEGPELFTPSGSGKIIPNDQLGGAASKSGGGPVSLNFNMSVGDIVLGGGSTAQDAESAARILKAEMKRFLYGELETVGHKMGFSMS